MQSGVHFIYFPFHFNYTTAASVIHVFSTGQTTPKIVPSHEGSRPLSNTWFLGSTGVSLSPNDISIGSAIFAWLMNVTNRQTDQATPYVAIGHILRTEKCMHATRPSNN